MPSASVIDLQVLLAPIAGDHPCGVDLRWEPIYDEIRSERTVEEDMLGASEAAEEEVNWSKVVDLAIDALSSRSKHLMVAAWLTEALTARDGFTGVRDGLRLTHGLLSQFWDGLYPLPDDGDLEPRVAPLVWLMDPDRGARLPNRIREIPLLPGDEDVFSWLYWKSRYAPPRSESESDEAYSRRKETAEKRERLFEDALATSDPEQVQALYEDIQECKTALLELDALVGERFGDMAPGVTAFRQSLEECEVLARRIARDKGCFTGPAEDDEADVGDEQDGAVDGQPQRSAAGPIQTREDAFRRLAEVSSYLRRTEPQSPVPLLIDRAITWGSLPFDQLLREMIKDESTRSQVSELLGIRSVEG